MHRYWLASTLFPLAAALLGCSSDVLTGSENGDPGTGGAGPGFGPGETGSWGAGPNGAFGECVSEQFQAETAPLDLYVLFDQSGSMSTPESAGTRLDAIRTATADFLGTPESTGVGFGIGYFGQFPIGSASCDPTDYEKPAVGIAPLPERSRAILNSLKAVEPTGETPTGPALRGACRHLSAWKAERPGRDVALLLLTDGVPEAPVSRESGCDPTLADAVIAAEECREDGVSVHVLGVGPNLENLHRIAKGGGTGQAHLIEGPDVAGEVFAALTEILGTALPCALEIPTPPEGQLLDYDRVNVVLTDPDGQPQVIGRVADSTACGAESGGWFYSSGKERIELCGTTCADAKAQSSGGSLEFALGCETVSWVR